MTVRAISVNVKSPWVFVPLLLLIFISTATFWFFYNFEKEEYTIHTGSSPQARKNPLLAAKEYLQQSGYRSESVEGLDLLAALPPSTDALVIRRLPGGLSNSITANLLNWVEQGGHLVMVPNANSQKSDHPGRNTLLEQLGIEVLEREKSNCGCPKKDDEKTTSESTDTNNSAADNTNDQPEKGAENSASTADPGPRNRIVYADLDEYSVQLETFRPRLLKDSSDTAVFKIDGSYFIDYEEEADKTRSDQNEYTEREGDWLLQYEWGLGRITVMSEMFLFSNHRIGDYDHAYFLTWLLSEAQTIWLLHSTEVESFLTLLWQKAPLFWLALLVVVVLTIWRLQMQSGSPLWPALDERHNIMYHIDATAQYNWRTNNLSAMVEGNRRTVWSDLISRKIGLQTDRQKMNVAISRLVQKTGMTEKQLQAAFQQSIETEQDIIRTSKLMQRINMLISGGDKRKNDKE